MPTVVGMPRTVRSKSGRGAELLDELAEVLPSLYGFDQDDDLDFAAMIALLQKYWDELKQNNARGGTKLRNEFLRVVNRMVVSYRETSMPAACGALIIACHNESSYLNDEEARLVHSITGIHLDRAASILNAKSTPCGKLAEAGQGELQDLRSRHGSLR